MSTVPSDILLVIGLVIPGVMCVYLGLRTLRVEWLAMETWVMLSPFIFLWWYFLVYHGYVAHFHSDMDLFRIIAFIVVGIVLLCLRSMGNILVLRGKRDVVVRGVRQILDRLNLAYTLDGDRFDPTDINKRIVVSHIEWMDLVGVQTPWRRVPIWTKMVNEEVLNLFVGRPSGRFHPAMLVVGIALLVLGLGVALGTG